MKTLAANILELFRNQHSGLICNLSELNGVPGVTPQISSVLQQETLSGPVPRAREIEMVGPKVGAELRQKAILATLYALAGMLVYICVPVRMDLRRGRGDRGLPRHASSPSDCSRCSTKRST